MSGNTELVVEFTPFGLRVLAYCVACYLVVPVIFKVFLLTGPREFRTEGAALVKFLGWFVVLTAPASVLFFVMWWAIWWAITAVQYAGYATAWAFTWTLPPGPPAERVQ